MGFKKSIILIILILSICNLGISSASTSLESTYITGFFVESKEGLPQFTIVADGTIEDYRVFTLKDPARIVIDVFNAKLATPTDSLNIQSKMLQRVRVGKYPDKVRFVLDSPLEEPPSFNINLGKNESTSEKIVSTKETKGLKEISPQEPEKKGPEKKRLKNFVPDKTQLRIWLKGAADINKDDEIESQYLFRNRTYMEFKWSDLFGLNALASGRVDYLRFTNGHGFDETDIEPMELYLEYAGKSFDFRVGNLILRWGKTDEISPVDNVNPQDMRELFALNLEDRKLPLPMARARWHFSGYTLEGIFIPHFEPNRFNYFDTDWAYFRHLKGSIMSMDIPPQLKDYVKNLSVKEDKPNVSLKNSEVGIRFLGTVRNFDFGLSAFYTRNRNPSIKSFPVKNLRLTSFEEDEFIDQLSKLTLTNEDIIAEFKRQTIFGLEFETTVNSFGLRGEMAYFTDQSLITNALTSVEKPVLHWVLGMDKSFNHGFYVNLQVSQRIIRDYDSSILFFKRVDTAGFLRLSKDFFRGKLKGRLDTYHSFSDDSTYFTPEIEYAVNSNLSFILGLNLIDGRPDTFLGQYDDNDQVYLSVLYIY